MKPTNDFTVIGRAMATVAGFDRVYLTLEQQVTPAPRSVQSLEPEARRFMP